MLTQQRKEAQIHILRTVDVLRNGHRAVLLIRPHRLECLDLMAGPYHGVPHQAEESIALDRCCTTRPNREPHPYKATSQVTAMGDGSAIAYAMQLKRGLFNIGPNTINHDPILSYITGNGAVKTGDAKPEPRVEVCRDRIATREHGRTQLAGRCRRGIDNLHAANFMQQRVALPLAILIPSAASPGHNDPLAGLQKVFHGLALILAHTTG